MARTLNEKTTTRLCFRAGDHSLEHLVSRICFEPYVFYRFSVDFGLADVAFDLAEDYGDFQNLAMLCVHLPAPSMDRIYKYLDRYRESFASPLYHLYIKNRG